MIEVQLTPIAVGRGYVGELSERSAWRTVEGVYERQGKRTHSLGAEDEERNQGHCMG